MIYDLMVKYDKTYLFQDGLEKKTVVKVFQGLNAYETLGLWFMLFQIMENVDEKTIVEVVKAVSNKTPNIVNLLKDLEKDPECDDQNKQMQVELDQDNEDDK
jgi:hypothetical protein